MAKPKEKFIVKLNEVSISIWCDNPHQIAKEIEGIEGVSQVIVIVGSSMAPIWAYTDPRYDREEIAAEIRQLLSAEVPQVFRGD